MIRVLVVDDSIIVRKVLAQELSELPDIEVVGTAADPYEAREKIVQLHPDVLTLDIEMPRMDGLTFLSRLMQHHPLPVVVVSSLTARSAEKALEAVERGAVEVVSKPGTSYSVPDVARQLGRAVRAAKAAKLRLLQAPDPTLVSAPAPAGPPELSTLLSATRLLAIGASTGGVTAIEAVLKRLPASTPGTVIVQHMPEHFTAMFAQRLNGLCRMEVREAKDGDAVRPGVALIAPGDRHLLLARQGARWGVTVKTGPPVHHQRPSVDVLFQSVARHAGRDALGVLLTGMGADGAAGLLAMRQAGSHTIVQDEASSAVFGMPKEAIALGAACEIEPLDSIAGSVLRSFLGQRVRTPA